MMTRFFEAILYVKRFVARVVKLRIRAYPQKLQKNEKKMKIS